MRETVFDHHGSRVRWVDAPGELPARVFVHGLGGTGWATFGAVAAHPALARHRTILLDLPGHGLSDRPSSSGYTLREHAEAVIAVCDDAGVDRIDLIGHSLGGDISITVAGLRPGLVGRLVIAEANLDPLPPTDDGERASQRIAARGEEDFVERGFAWLFDAYPGWEPTLRACDARGVHRSAVGLVTGTRPTMREVFVGLDMPRTFIRGDRGEPLVGADGLVASGVRIVTIADAGHMMMVDQPAAFIDAIAAVLSIKG